MTATSMPLMTLIAVLLGLTFLFVFLVLAPAISNSTSSVNKAMQVCEEGFVGKLKCIPTFMLWSTKVAGAPGK